MGHYRNVMELLVEEEVVKQVKALPSKTASYINPTELTAYALNQLPSLYATSEKGLDHQLQRGKSKYAAQIAQAVQRAVAAIIRDPLRTSPPLTPQTATPFREVLQQLRRLLHNDAIDWETLPTVVEQALARSSRSLINPEGRASSRSLSTHSPVRRSSPFPQYSNTPPEQNSSRKPSASDSPQANPPQDEFGWDDPFYSSH